MSKIIVFSHVMLYSNGMISSLGIRTRFIVQTLDKLGHDITVAEKSRKKKSTLNNINYIPWDKEMLDNIENFDVAIIQIWANDREFLEHVSKIPLVVDVFAPYMIEHTYHNYDLTKRLYKSRFKNDVLTPSFSPFLYADKFICANEQQKKYYYGLLSALGRISPYSKHKSLIDIVEQGIPKSEIKQLKLSSAIPKLKNKKIILWPGTFYPWFDPLSALNAAKIVAKKYPDYALVFFGGKNPRIPRYLTTKIYENLMDQAGKEGLLDKNVFFCEWLEEDKFHGVLMQSEFALVTYFKSLESDLAYRFRYLDCLKTNTPILCTSGDSFSKVVEKQKLGIVFPQKDPKKLADSIIKLIKSNKLKQLFKSNIINYIQNYPNDEILIKSLHDYCSNPVIDKDKQVFSIYNMLQDNRSEIIHLKWHVEEKEGHRKELEKGNSERQKEIDRLSKKLLDFDQVISDKQNEITGRDKHIHELNMGANKLKDDLGKLEMDFKEAQNKIVSVERDVKDRDYYIGTLQSQINNVNKELHKIRAENSNNLVQLDLINKLFINSEKSIKDRDIHIKNLEIHIEKNKFEIDEKARKLESMHKEIDVKNQIISNLKNSNSILDEKISELNNTIEKTNQEIDIISANMHGLLDNFKIQLEKSRMLLNSREFVLLEKDNFIEEMAKDYEETITKNNQILEQKNNELISLAHIVSSEKKLTGQFKASIMYPLYKITHNIGETRIGKILQKFKR